MKNVVNVVTQEARVAGMETKEYAQYCLENDPTFFGYILASYGGDSVGDSVGDYGVGATEGQKIAVAEFISKL